MKKLITLVSLLLLLFAVINLNAATLYTPNGKSFSSSDAGRSSYNADYFEAWKTNNFGPGKPYPNSEVLGEWENGLWEYNCHVFAWNNWQGAARWSSESDMWTLGKPSPYNLLWRDYPDVWYTDSDNPIGIVSYIETSNQNEASIVTYKSGSTITHSARIVGSGTRYISKWGSNPIVKHPPTEVPSFYGSRYKYYKINPAYRPVGTGDPAGRNWGTIENALSGIPSGGAVSVYSGTYMQSNNITINNNITLYLKPGVTLKFGSGKKLTINSTLKAEGTYSNRITFRSQSGTWYGIEFNNGSSSSRVRYCTIKNAQVGIHMIHTNVYLHDNKIEYNTTGLLFENYSDGSGIVNCHEISFNSSYGIRCKTYSDPLIFSSNTIHDNGWGYAGIYGDASSIFDLGRYSDQGHNSIYWNDPYEVQSSYSGTIYARYNWWDDPDPDPNVSSNVDWSNYLTSDPNTMLAKAVTHQSHSGSSIMKVAASNHRYFRSGLRLPDLS